MSNSQITTRPAELQDAKIIAKVVAMAIGGEDALRAYCGDDYLSVLTEIARHKGTQYSWQHAIVAEVNGNKAGAVVGYDGARLEELREGTFAVLRKQIGRVPIIADETEDGEVYLDSVGVLPEFRGLGVGRELVTTFCKKNFAEGYERVGLIVDQDNPKAERLYTSLGFQRVGTRLFFGYPMWHLQKVCDMDIREKVLLSKQITEFQRRVYIELLNIPAGTTISYGELAARIGCKSAQAVGQALKRNPFAPEVPCHRVIAADGSLGGYNGKRQGEQLARKRALLDEESRNR